MLNREVSGEIPGLLVILAHVETIRLGVFHLDCTAAGVDIAAVQVFLRLHGRIQVPELHHGLHVELLEDDNPVHLAQGLANLVNDIHGNGIVGVQDGQQHDPVGRGAGRVLPGQLLLHLARRQSLVRVNAASLGGGTVTRGHFRVREFGKD